MVGGGCCRGGRRLAGVPRAARAAGVNRLVQESIAFVYADGGDAWLEEDAPVAGGIADGATAVAGWSGTALPTAGRDEALAALAAELGEMDEAELDALLAAAEEGQG